MIEISKFCRYAAADVLENQILAFYDRNPDEELTSGDVAVKFDRGIHKVRAALKGLTDRGLLNRVGVRTKVNQLTYIYRRAS
jgi:predicted transcriptional regulator